MYKQIKGTNQDYPVPYHDLSFATGSLARRLTQLADAAFAPTGLPPSLAFLLLAVQEQPGRMQTELAAGLNLAPSTLTRFIDRLEGQGYLERQTEGRAAYIYLTEEGAGQLPALRAAQERLHTRLQGILGAADHHELLARVNAAATKLAGAAGPSQ